MEKTIAIGAVLIVILIILVAAYAIGVSKIGSNSTTSIIATTSLFGGSTTSVNGNVNYAAGCTGASNYTCTGTTISNSGAVSISLSQNTANTLYDVHVACGVLDLQGALVNGSSWYVLTNLGTTKGANFTGTSIAPGSIENIASLQCYNQTGSPISVGPGRSYLGVIVLEYTNSSAAPGNGNPWITETVAHVNLNSSAT